ncbi:MAG: type 4a pilus biogenesis protein PilO [candidate division Zixibacteria bacterium]|jgi:type IV pilus assembly protein PilO|nr:type 4a pilus biogenesis protein PilO [candidate division Zixibacteria bacterium]
MDLKDSKTQKIVIAVLAFFIVVYFWYSRLFSSYNSQINNSRQEFETITTDLRNVEMKAKSLDALKVEYADLTGRYQQIESLLPEVKQVPSILVQLHTASSITGTRITKIHPLPVASQEFYEVASFEVEMVGTYHDFGRFVSYVANFPFIANVTDVQIAAENRPKGTSVGVEDKDVVEVGRKKATMNAKFTLMTYYVKESERLAELSL